MKWIICLLFCVSSIQINAQIPLSKQEELKIIETCNSYLKEYALFTTDKSLSDSALKTVCADTLLQLIKWEKEEIEIHDYQISFSENTVYELINRRNLFACEVVSEDNSTYTLNLQLYEDKWKVAGYDDKPITTEIFESCRQRIDSIRGVGLELEIIKETASYFITYLNELNHADSSEKLKNYTSVLFYQTLALSAERRRIIGARPKEDLILKTIEQPRLISADSATCRLSVVPGGGSTFVLKKINGNWKVVGEGYRTPTPQEIQSQENEIAETQLLMNVLKAMNDFKTSLELSLQKNDPALLQNIASPVIINYFNYFKMKCSDVNPEFIFFRMFDLDHFDLHDFSLQNETEASYCKQPLCINFQLIDGKWVVVGINNEFGEALMPLKMEREFYDIKSLFQIYWPRNTPSLLTFTETHEQSETGIDFVIFSIDDSIPEPIDTTIYSVLQWGLQRASYASGNEYLISHLNPSLNPNNSKFCYVSFVVEMDGAISNIKILNDHLSELERNAVHTKIKSMGQWHPGTKYEEKIRNSIIVLVEI